MLTEFVIDRKRWLRGEEDSMLLRGHDGKMCCLGFAGRACGIADTNLLGESSPDSTSVVGMWPEWIMGYSDNFGALDSNDTSVLIRINDSRLTSDAEKEAKIIVIFARHGVTVRFVDEAPAPQATAVPCCSASWTRRKPC